jgi:hypothetical protein
MIAVKRICKAHLLTCKIHVTSPNVEIAFGAGKGVIKENRSDIAQKRVDSISCVVQLHTTRKVKVQE